MKKQIATYIALGSLAFGAGQVTNNEFDCKGQECQVQVLIREDKFNDAIYYKPAVWNEKNEQDINAEKKARVDKHKAFIEEESKKVTPLDEENP